MKGDVRFVVSFLRAKVGFHVGEAGGNGSLLFRSGAHGSERRSCRLDNQAYLTKRADELLIHDRSGLPRQNVGVEKVPVPPRPDAHSHFRTQIQKPFGDQHLEGLAQDRPAHPQALAEDDLGGDLAFLQFSAEDR